MDMKKILRRLSLVILAITCMASCAHEQGTTGPARIDQGQVFLYLSCSRKPTADVAFSLSGLAFMNDMGEWVDVPMEGSVDSSTVCGRQIKLSEFYLSPGKYRRRSNSRGHHAFRG